MKKIIGLILAMVLAIPLFVMPAAEAGQVALNLKAQWTANAEPDMAYYLIQVGNGGGQSGGYYTGPTTGTTSWGVTWQGNSGSATHLLLSPTLLPFVYQVSDTPQTGSLTFTLNAVDTNANVSPNAQATYNYNCDVTPPAAPTGFTVIKQ
jgi:hypothetical protein